MIAPEQDQKKARIKKRNTYESAFALYEDELLMLPKVEQKLFPLKSTNVKGLKILAPKQTLQRLPIALAQVKVYNAPDNLIKSGKSHIFCIKQKKLLKNV